MDYEELKNIYRLGFPEDGEKYIDYFFSEKIKDAKIFCCRQDGRIISAAYIFDKKLRLYGGDITLPFLVAAATLPEYRGQKFFGKVMNEIFLKYKESPFIALYPFKHSYYSSAFGFTNYNYLRKRNFSVFADKLPQGMSAKRASGADDFKIIYDIYSSYTLGFDSYIVRELADFQKKADELSSDGGGAVIIADKSGAPVGYIYHDGGGMSEEYCFKDAALYARFTGAELSKPAAMIRVINSGEALKMIKWKDGEFTVGVDDGFSVTNGRLYRVKTLNGRTAVSESSASNASAPDCVLDTSVLADIIFDRRNVKKMPAQVLPAPALRTLCLDVY
ncbi:MAG: GNAT family N-acetyltransferase [Clostridiales bacterium]|jgi:predicted acetyltransferase|nr:GNAT family N-acetyltransferase [Clostridiales bacterium]